MRLPRIAVFLAVGCAGFAWAAGHCGHEPPAGSPEPGADAGLGGATGADVSGDPADRRDGKEGGTSEAPSDVPVNPDAPWWDGGGTKQPPGYVASLDPAWVDDDEVVYDVGFGSQTPPVAVVRRKISALGAGD